MKPSIITPKSQGYNFETLADNERRTEVSLRIPPFRGNSCPSYFSNAYARILTQRHCDILLDPVDKKFIKQDICMSLKTLWIIFNDLFSRWNSEENEKACAFFEECETILYCLRPNSDSFDEFFDKIISGLKEEENIICIDAALFILKGLLINNKNFLQGPFSASFEALINQVILMIKHADEFVRGDAIFCFDFLLSIKKEYVNSIKVNKNPFKELPIDLIVEIYEKVRINKNRFDGIALTCRAIHQNLCTDLLKLLIGWKPQFEAWDIRFSSDPTKKWSLRHFLYLTKSASSELLDNYILPGLQSQERSIITTASSMLKWLSNEKVPLSSSLASIVKILKFSDPRKKDLTVFCKTFSFIQQLRIIMTCIMLKDEKLHSTPLQIFCQLIDSQLTTSDRISVSNDVSSLVDSFFLLDTLCEKGYCIFQELFERKLITTNSSAFNHLITNLIQNCIAARYNCDFIIYNHSCRLFQEILEQKLMTIDCPGFMTLVQSITNHPLITAQSFKLYLKILELKVIPENNALFDDILKAVFKAAQYPDFFEPFTEQCCRIITEIFKDGRLLDKLKQHLRIIPNNIHKDNLMQPINELLLDLCLLNKDLQEVILHKHNNFVAAAILNRLSNDEVVALEYFETYFGILKHIIDIQYSTSSNKVHVHVTHLISSFKIRADILEMIVNYIECKNHYENSYLPLSWEKYQYLFGK